MDSITCTTTFSKKLKSWFKLNNQSNNVDNFDVELEKAFYVIKNIEDGKMEKIRDAEEYFQLKRKEGYFSEVAKNIFKIYKPFKDNKLAFVFVICKECRGILKCSNDCKEKLVVSKCLYDVSYEY
ncbi:MAG: hypothetical protein A3J65_00605 [Candidatus Buchananbacteria bacterium RIFCSPHIGHO2_02_FULL_45_11b]|uniref:Uncharacterized protein n=3 Tax=Candidatus Buchananiibacteriota TaxID=1817903 RepID=A0A1G1Y417_9BACT|nr:MAG: hypothetical protein A2663_04005 [Candidatus Buchananbacteria bacterium RIFCSPHIGHO2_01_FULL_46_12]OGY52361.1 MAG: hypothetical protein A3J65_00605 [Candidatus Buchananbacteria bacterium RIFCSPHIGHO2_02_FULL_45_11b]OGY53199.1 MAG: hypothetical protein A3B15_02865 [Candidatus Buchananbacteria bacterium RIFCSPLOWO2_01_FULL_45_31]